MMLIKLDKNSLQSLKIAKISSLSIVIIIITIIGVHFIISSHAASPFATVRASDGVAIGSASINSCSGSTGGNCLTFGNSTSSAGYTTTGNKIIGPDGRQFIPLGMTVYGIVTPYWAVSNPNQQSTTYVAGVNNDIPTISAAKKSWSANTIRLQVSPYYLECSPSPSSYLSTVENEVNFAISQNLNVIISAQYQETNALPVPTACSSVFGTNPKSHPDSSTTTFWKTIAPIFSNNTHVWYELYNEPVGESYPTWQSGDQALVDAIRTIAPNNLIIAESIDSPPRFVGSDNYLLGGSNIVYAVHPYFDNQYLNQTCSTTTFPCAATYDAGTWEKYYWYPGWANLAQTHPVIISEWGEHESTRFECQTNAQAIVEGDSSGQGFLKFISSQNIGIIGWALSPGALIYGNGDSYTSANIFSATSPYLCPNNNDGNSQGAGADFQAFTQQGGNYH